MFAATDEELLACVSGSHTRLRILRDAAAQADAVQDLPDFAEILPAAND